ncbi:GntR family transcriptional regulator [Micromonospora sp. NPDC023814]|uniref:GntR family transcriptional regulator n=1 Tax=Micromonospora sp. NPDC023814 TaxID=3154596 RepID=UPI0033E99191
MPTPHYGQPRYRTIANELRQRIEDGEIPPGALLPAESTLTSEFRVSRGTIRHAIAALRDAGLVATEHGRGTYAVAFVPPASQAETKEREVAADADLAILFKIEVGAALIEREVIVRRSGRAQEVVRTYRLPDCAL